MLTALAASMSLLTAPAVVWSDAYQVHEAGLAVPQAGIYTVWAWVPGPDGMYQWEKTGSHDFDAGPVQIDLPEDAVSVVLTTDSPLDPNVAMADRRVYLQPKTVDDHREAHPRHTDYVFNVKTFGEREEWERFAEALRLRILIGSGLFPLPERTPLNPHVSGRIERDGYSVEKVYFEAWPGFLCTGNLYRPLGDGPYPAIATPHGHWDTGRLENTELASVPGRCITLARMGIVTFTYDMIGYNDSLQFSHDWGGPDLNLWGIHPFSMQLWTSMRVLDFLESLPYVDDSRLGCTGASGGGTQTFALTATDSRVQAAAPVNMISRSMQGGCLCENAPLLRLHNSNIEIGALTAPKPLLMVSATGDWTVETPRYEYPAIRRIFALYGAEDRLSQQQVDASHNYNRQSREAMYRFFGRWFLDQSKDWSTFEEPPFTVESRDDLRVFPDGVVPPEYPSKDAILADVRERIRQKWSAVLPQDSTELGAFRQDYGVALSHALAAVVPDVNDLDPERLGRDVREGYAVERWVIRRPGSGDAIPALVYVPTSDVLVDAVLISHGGGKAALADPAGEGPGALVHALLRDGKMVMIIDTYLQGEHHHPAKRTVPAEVGRFIDRLETRANETFAPTDTAFRVQDLLTASAYLRGRLDCSGNVSMVGLTDAGIWALFAGALDPLVNAVWVDFNGFDREDDAAWAQRYYVPGIRAIGDVVTAAALIAPRTLRLANVPDRSRDALEGIGAALGSDLQILPENASIDSAMRGSG